MDKKLRTKVHAEDLLIIAGLLVRSFLTFSHNYWFDEKVTLNISQLPIAKLMHMAALDNHPPLYYFYIKLFSPLLLDAYLLRFTSVLLGTISLWVAFKLFSMILDRTGALIALTLLAFSPLHIYYSTEIRMYPMLILMGLCVLWSLIKYLQSSQQKYLWLYSLFSALAMYTHYYGALLLAGSVVYTFVVKRKNLLKICIYSFLSILLFSPWVMYVINFPKPGCWCFPPHLGVPALFASFTVGLMGHFDIFDAILTSRIPLLFKLIYYLNATYFFVLYLLSIRKNYKNKLIRLQVFLWLPVLVMSLVSLKANLLSIRSFIVFSPVYYLTIAQYLKDTSKHRVFITLGIILMLSVALMNAKYAWDL